MSDYDRYLLALEEELKRQGDEDKEDGKRVMVDPQTLKPLDAVPIAHPEP